VVDDLVVLKLPHVDILGFKRPLQVEANRVFVLVLDPASLLECTLDITIASRNNENFGCVIYSVLFSPLFHISDVQEDLVVRNVSLQEILDCLHGNWRHLYWHSLRTGFVTVAFGLQRAVLLLAQGWLILIMLKLSKYSIPCLLDLLLLPHFFIFNLLKLGILFQLDLIKLLLLARSDLFCSSLAFSSFLEQFLLSVLIKHQHSFGIDYQFSMQCRLWHLLVSHAFRSF
jgi:hypothetical protein